MFGARRLYRLLQYQGVLSELYIDCQAHHGLSYTTPGYTCDYGTGATNDAAVYEYIAQRAATFFQLCLNGITTVAAGPTTTLFVESKNNRNTCDLTDNVTTVCTECTNVSTDGACYNPDF